MSSKFYKVCFVLLLSFVWNKIQAQPLKANGGILLKTQLVLGNQNQSLHTGLYAFGALNYNNISTEHGFSLMGYKAVKRHNVKVSGFGLRYEFFTLIGYGKNLNLLGSTVSNQNTAFLLDTSEKSSFKGFGFGFEKEILPKELKQYQPRRGKLIVRVAEGAYSFHINFLNDFKIGKLFYGQGSDFAETGSLHVGFSKMMNRNELFQLGTSFTIFTPEPDYLKSPRNPINSDDGRKNVWFVKPQGDKSFYGNWYVSGLYQKNLLSNKLSVGVNSQKIGAYIQNWLHDGFGLNPRYPWNVKAKNKLYYELESNAFLKVQ
ncbi:hypothetical protein [Wenyingzhuangia sp. IMCC45574]